MLLRTDIMAGLVWQLGVLLQAGVSPNGSWTKANPGVTPLHVACYHGNVECVGVLLGHGANKNAVDRLQATPAHYAAAKVID
jgi:hypothetical protein